MVETEIIYSRAKLHAEVWEEPVRVVAQRYGVSDVALAKMCRRWRIPLPARGYWAKRHAGQQVETATLPPLPDGESETRVVRKWRHHTPEEIRAAEEHFEKQQDEHFLREDLRVRIKAWRIAKEMREFADAAEARLPNASNQQESEQWVKWLRNKQSEAEHAAFYGKKLRWSLDESEQPVMRPFFIPPPRENNRVGRTSLKFVRDKWTPSLVGTFYFDESIHVLGEFIVGVFVYTNRNIDSDIDKALTLACLEPGIEEFKSGAPMKSRPELQTLRDEMFVVLRENCRIGIVVTPIDERAQLGAIALQGLEKILVANDLLESAHDVFFDESIWPSERQAATAIAARSSLARCAFHMEQDSKICRGIQLADAAAHCCSRMLLHEMGLANKAVAGEPLGYVDSVDLSHECFGRVRYNFFCGEIPREAIDDPLATAVNVSDYGLFIADLSPSWLREAALHRFGSMYLGCTH
jgi:hypothetical protein